MTKEIQDVRVFEVLHLDKYNGCLKCKTKLDPDLGYCQRCSMMQCLDESRQELTAQLMIKGTGDSHDRLIYSALLGKSLSTEAAEEVWKDVLLKATPFIILHLDDIIHRIQSPKNELTPLDVAAARDQHEVCKLLISHMQTSAVPIQRQVTQALRELVKKASKRAKQAFINLEVRIFRTDKMIQQLQEVKSQSRDVDGDSKKKLSSTMTPEEEIGEEYRSRLTQN